MIAVVWVLLLVAVWLSILRVGWFVVFGGERVVGLVRWCFERRRLLWSLDRKWFCTLRIASRNSRLPVLFGLELTLTAVTRTTGPLDMSHLFSSILKCASKCCCGCHGMLSGHGN